MSFGTLPNDDPCGGEFVEGEFEYLVFQRHHGRWRFMYVRTRTEGHIGMDGPSPDWLLEQRLERRPLIETKADVRLRAVKTLPAFLETVARGFGMEPEPVDFDEIPW